MDLRSSNFLSYPSRLFPSRHLPHTRSTLLPPTPSSPSSPEFVDGDFTELVELDLLREDVERDIDRPSKPAPALVVIQDGVEAGPVAVEKVLIPERVEVADSPRWVAQEGVRKLVQRPELRLKPKTAYLRWKQEM